MVDAILYQARTGCQWRYLPPQFGPWGTVWQQLRRWRDNGTWARAMDRLRRAARQRAGRNPEPSMVMVDSQTVTGGRAGPTYHDTGGPAGRTYGAKRTILADYLGLPVAARVDSARPHDSKAGRLLCDTALPALPRVDAVLADAGFHGLVATIAPRHNVTVPSRPGNPSPKASSPSSRSGESKTASPSSDDGDASPAASRGPSFLPRHGSTSPASGYLLTRV